MYPLPATDLPADTVVLRRVRLCTGAVPGGGVADQVRRALAGADWPRPDGGAWVLLRSVAARARTPAGIGPAAARAVAARIAAAVDLDDPAAAQADAVRARDRDALLAHLARDLALGRAAARWYWRAWATLVALPTGAALRELLAGQPARLAAVTARLAALDALALVWHALPAAAADDLLAHLSDALALQVPRGADAGPGDANGAADGAAGGDPAGPDAAQSPPAHLVARWHPALAGLPVADVRVRLAAVLVALEWRPLWLTATTDRTTGARRLAAVAVALRGPMPPGGGAAGSVPGGLPTLAPESTPPAAPIPAPVPAPRSAPAAAADASGPSVPRGPDRPPTPAGLTAVAPRPPAAGPVPGSLSGLADAGRGSPDANGRGRGDGERDESARAARADQARALRADPNLNPDPDSNPEPIGAASPPPSVRHRMDIDRLRVRAGPITAPAPVTQPPEPQPPEPAAGRLASSPLAAPAPALYTDEGGLFYLVNFLARPEAQALLRAKDAGSRPGSGLSADVDGWAWLRGLGLRLGLDPNGALAAFLADQRGAPWPQDAATESLLDRLADLGARLFGVATGGDGGLWRPDLLGVPALVDATPSHLDVRYPLGAVRLAVRRVALDVNPGWVPWLGRVLTFHYVEPWPGPPGDLAPASPSG